MRRGLITQHRCAWGFHLIDFHIAMMVGFLCTGEYDQFMLYFGELSKAKEELENIEKSKQGEKEMEMPESKPAASTQSAEEKKKNEQEE